jgi:MarR family 2-MHQ and catechol resistance regulon transcriptional repressor
MDINIKLMTIFSRFSYTLIEKLNKDLAYRGMTMTTYTMLAYLNQVTETKTQKLGEVALITSGTITHVVNQMIQNGFVIKVKDECDQRVNLVRITDLGRNEFNKVHEPHIKYLELLLSDITIEEKQAFMNQLKYIGNKIKNKEINK